MSRSSTYRGRRLAASVGAASLIAMSIAGLSTAASAEPSELEFGNIAEDAKGSIIVHKHEHQTDTEIEARPNGADPAIPSAGVEDVEFTVYKLLKDDEVVDLTKPEEWDDLADITVSGDPCAITGPEGYSIGDAVGDPKYTNADGEVTFSGLSVGAYVVCETDAPATVTDTADPFIVTIPFPYEKGWLYDVHVYPKNGTSTVEKEIVPQDGNGVGLGSVIQFPVTVTIPSLAPDRDFTSFDIQDALDERLGSVGVASVQVSETDVDEDYYEVNVDEQKVTVSFKTDDEAVQNFLKANATEDLVVTFQGVVVELGDGVIENQAVAFVNDPSHDNGNKSNEVTTNWGDVRILKTNDAEGDDQVGLAGAIFEVYNAAEPYGTCAGAEATGSALDVLVDGTMVNKFTSDDQGLVFIPGLFVSDSVNSPVDAEPRCYVLKEVQAPAGYVTPDEAFFPIAVRIGATADTVYDAEIENTQQDVPELPLTGAAGQVLMVVGGVALLLLASGMVILNRRKAAQK